jgi:hypothetical protein
MNEYTRFANAIPNQDLNRTSTANNLPDDNDKNAPVHLYSQPRTLCLDFSGLGYFPPFGARFPTIEMLSLNRYDWRHTSESYKLLWDFFCFFGYEVCLSTAITNGFPLESRHEHFLFLSVDLSCCYSLSSG